MKTVTALQAFETEEKRSRFLAELMPYSQYRNRLEELRALHPKANHHVSAFRFFDADKRLHEGAKDDGEPSGTSGPPMLKVLQGHDLVNCAVIVTRYFGGTKLGTGGLARAYGGAARAVIEQADLIDFHHQATVTLKASYERVKDLERLLSGVQRMERTFTETGVQIEITDNEDAVNRIISEWERLNY